MTRPTRYPGPLAALLCATVALGACGSDGDADDAEIPPADDPAAGADDVAFDDGGNGADGVPDELPDATGAGTAGVADAGDGTDVPDADASGTDADPDATVPGSDVDDTDTPAPVDGDAPSGTVSRFGIVAVLRDVDGASTVAATFYGIDGGVPLDDGLVEPLPAPDTCSFDSAGGGGIDTDRGFDVPDLEASGRPLSAGDNIVATGPGGTFATLRRTEVGDVVVYLPEGRTVPGSIPPGLVVDIPGDEFPAFAAVRVPDAVPLTGVTPADLEGATADTTFGWDAGADESVRVIVEVAFLGTDPLVSVTCSAADDGEFRLPASLLARIPDGQPANANLGRVGSRVLRDGDAVLLVTSASGR